jgi:MarR family transcriptional regulator, transcriptional regulator for hemolysin
MAPLSPNREFAFLLSDVARLLRTYADHRAAQFGITRAQWAVLVRVDRAEGLNQSELAETLDLQPITLTRLLDKLCVSGLIERRPDPDDRRAKRLYLTPAARPLLEQLRVLGEETMVDTLAGVDRSSVENMLAKLSVVKENLRRLIHERNTGTASGERRYG